jgi:uncharacterized protein with HEPN domain
MSERSALLIIKTMLECIQDTTDFTAGHQFETFILDKKTKYAVLRTLEVLGEAANRIPKDVRKRYPEVEWGRIIRSRNLIVHEYEIIDYTVIWKIVTVHLPPLEVILKKISKDFDS